jgi:hypothetical protein
MAAPIRSSAEIALILNKANNAIADIGYDLIGDAKRGDDLSETTFRDKVYRLILLRAYLKNLVAPEDGDWRAWYTSSVNEKIFNTMLDGVIQLSGIYDGPGIPLIRGKRIPLYFYPSTSGSVTTVVVASGTSFENLDVDSPSEVIDSFPASEGREFVVYNYKVRGSNGGEGSRAGQVIGCWRGTSIDFTDIPSTPDVGGITSPIRFEVQSNSGNIELVAYVSTNNWVVQGTRET